MRDVLFIAFCCELPWTRRSSLYLHLKPWSIVFGWHALSLDPLQVSFFNSSDLLPFRLSRACPYIWIHVQRSRTHILSSKGSAWVVFVLWHTSHYWLVCVAENVPRHVCAQIITEITRQCYKWSGCLSGKNKNTKNITGENSHSICALWYYPVESLNSQSDVQPHPDKKIVKHLCLTDYRAFGRGADLLRIDRESSPFLYRKMWVDIYTCIYGSYRDIYWIYSLTKLAEARARRRLIDVRRRRRFWLALKREQNRREVLKFSKTSRNSFRFWLVMVTPLGVLTYSVSNLLHLLYHRFYILVSENIIFLTVS